MRLPLLWLHDFCRPDLDARALAHRLAMTGTEVDRVLNHGVGSLEHFVVGRVLEAEPHPDAASRYAGLRPAKARSRRSSAARPTSPPAKPWPSRSPAR